MIAFGEVPANSTLPIPFASFDSAGASVTLSGLALTDVEIYKGTSMTQRASDAGVVLMDTDGIDLDGITGINGFSIDLSDNTDAGFYAVGSFFWVVVSAVTIDSQTVNFVAATFRIKAAEAIAGKAKVDVDGWLGTACATPTVNGVPEVDVTHIAGSTTDVSTIPASVAAILVDTGTTLDGRIPAALVGGRMDASVGAMAANVLTAAATAADFSTEVNTAPLAILGTPAGASMSADIAAVKADTAAILVDTGTTLDGRIPAALVGGRMDASVGAMAANVLTAAATAADFSTEVNAAPLAILGTPAGASMSADIAAIEAQTDDIGAAGAGLTAVPWNAAWDAEVQSEVVDALNVDTYAEIGQETPAATQTIRKMLGYLYKAWRNRSSQDATTYLLYGDDAATVHQKSTVSDDATTFESGEKTTGP